MQQTRLFAVFGLVFLAIMSRLLPHPPNFTAINAVAVFSAFTLRHNGLSSLVVFAAMMISDLIIGLHSQLFFVYVSLGLTVLMSRWRTPVITLPLSVFLFFVIVNFGVWLIDGFYPLTLNGLVLCYVASLPFLANQFISAYVYGIALFGLFALCERYLRTQRMQRT